MKKTFQITLLNISLAASSFAANINDALKTFEDNPGYSSPLATYMGTLHNSSWISTTKIDKKIGFTFGIDLNTAFLSQGDTEYQYRFKTNCSELRQTSSSTTGYCPDYEDKRTLPTIFGGSSDEVFTKYTIDPTSNTFQPFGQDNANEGLLDATYLGLPQWIAMPYLYGTYSQEYTEIKLKGLYLPIEVSNHNISLSIFGIGINHDIAHYAGYKWPINVSVYANMTLWGLDYINKKNTGTLELNGLTYSYGTAVSKQWGSLEVIGLLGMESSSFDSSGEILVNGDPADKIEPRVSVEGLNNFKAAVNLTLHFGSYQLFNSNTFGAQRSHNLNFMNYRYQSK